MKWFSYRCPRCGPFDVDAIAEDSIQCRCGMTAKRKYSVSFIGSSLKSEARWDPVVGAYVENDAQFRSLLAKGQDEQAEKLQMDCKLATIDARDQEGLAELHGQSPDERGEQIEQFKKDRHDALKVDKEMQESGYYKEIGLEA
jgi:hypothetical protein